MKRKLFIILACWLWAWLFSKGTNDDGRVFFASYDESIDADYTATGNNQAIVENAPSILPFTDEGEGVDGCGQGIIIARDNLDDFKDIAAHVSALAGIRYNIANLIDAKRGIIDMWVKPYFNSTSPYEPNRNMDFGIYQLFSVGSVRCFIFKDTSDCYLALCFQIEGGVAHTLKLTPVDWAPKTWHRLTFVWDTEKKILYADGIKEDEKNLKGSLVLDKSMLIGANSSQQCIAQCVFDKLAIYNQADSYSCCFKEK